MISQQSRTKWGQHQLLLLGRKIPGSRITGWPALPLIPPSGDCRVNVFLGAKGLCSDGRFRPREFCAPRCQTGREASAAFGSLSIGAQTAPLQAIWC